MKWFHQCNLDWLKARQQCLTATDIKELLPVTKTGRKRTVTDENYLKVFASKLVNLTESDCISVGAAARGHVLEPYAIDRYNEEDSFGKDWLWHWDDIVVTKMTHMHYGLAFSPDAMNIKQGEYSSRMITANGVTTIGEVKSYSPERHFVSGHTPKEDLEERWQIATAMAVCPSISEAYLMFYNPSMKDQLYIVDYDRSDLYDEINTILEIEDNWLSWIANLNKLDKHYLITGNPEEEGAIIQAIMKREEMNPEGTKSVTL